MVDHIETWHVNWVEAGFHLREPSKKEISAFKLHNMSVLYGIDALHYGKHDVKYQMAGWNEPIYGMLAKIFDMYKHWKLKGMKPPKGKMVRGKPLEPTDRPGASANRRPTNVAIEDEPTPKALAITFFKELPPLTDEMITMCLQKVINLELTLPEMDKFAQKLKAIWNVQQMFSWQARKTWPECVAFYHHKFVCEEELGKHRIQCGANIKKSGKPIPLVIVNLVNEAQAYRDMLGDLKPLTDDERAKIGRGIYDVEQMFAGSEMTLGDGTELQDIRFRVIWGDSCSRPEPDSDPAVPLSGDQEPATGWATAPQSGASPVRLARSFSLTRREGPPLLHQRKGNRRSSFFDNLGGSRREGAEAMMQGRRTSVNFSILLL